MMTKHGSMFAVYTSWKGREHLHTLVEECSTEAEAKEKAITYTDSTSIVYVVDKFGNVIHTLTIP